MKNKKNTVCAAEFSRAELGFMVSRLSEMLDEHIDAIFVAAADDGFLTPERIAGLIKTQRAAQSLAEAFAPDDDFGGLL